MRIHLTIFSTLLLPLTAAAQDITSSNNAPSATNLGSTPLGSSIAAASSGATTIYTDIVALPNSVVPGLTATFESFDRVFGSPNGNWVLSADSNLATTEDELILLNNAVIAREGTQADWAGVGEFWGLIDTKLGVNDLGEVVAATNSSGVTTADEFIIMRDTGGTWISLAREGDATGLLSLPGTTWGSSLDTPVITSGSATGWSADLIGGATTTTNDLLVLGGNVLMQVGVTVPPLQVAAETIENFDIDDFHVSADGLNWIVLGDLTGATTDDDVAIVNGDVRLQENVIIPGSSFTDPIDLSGIVNIFMDAGGNWYARGNNDVSEQDWVVRNGVVIATLGQSVDGVSTEVWDDTAFSDCFFMHTGNSLGDYVIGGVTNNIDPLRDGLLVLNGTTELARQGDPVDLDGNGLFDDNAFFNTFGNDDGYLSDSGDFYFVATLMDGAGAGIGDGFFHIDTLGPNTGVAACDGSGGQCPCFTVGAVNQGCPNSNSANGAQLVGSGHASITSDTFSLAVTEAAASTAGLVLSGTADLSPGINTISDSAGLLCVGGTTLRGAVVFTDASGNASLPDFQGAPYGMAGNVSANGLSSYQYWYRDPGTACAPNDTAASDFNFSNAWVVTWLP